MSSQNIPLFVSHAYQDLIKVANAKFSGVLERNWVCIEKNPADVNAVNVLGAVAEQSGQYALAETFFRYALDLRPDIAQLHGNLAVVLRRQGKIDAAVEVFKAALDIDPRQESYYLAVADVYVKFKEEGLLLAWLEKALQQCPGSAALLVQMGEAVKRTGKTELALTYFRKALKLAPKVSYIHQTLAHTKKFHEYDEDVAAMEALFKSDDLSDADRGRLCFSLGKVYEDLADYNESFKYYAQGNDLIRSGYDYCIDDDVRLFAEIRRVFNGQLFKRYAGSGYASEAPVFILGMPRSGSTLIEQMLAAHAQVYGAGELSLLANTVNRLWSENIDPQGLLYPAGIDAVSIEALRNAGEYYVNRALNFSDQDNVARITDKMPPNFLYIGLIKLILPNARIIHCRRDAMDTCFSCYKHYFTGGHRYTFNLEELGEYYKLYQGLMDHWHQVLPGHILDIDYEALVEDQAGELKKILEFCGLPWDDHCMTFYESENTAITASSVQVKQPLYKSALGYWRHYENELAGLKKILSS